MQRKFLFAAVIAVAPLSALAQSGDNAARNLAAACAICHGTEGRAITRDVIPLAGLPKDHIASQMQAFRDGKRPATVMHQIAKGYTDQQIAQLAAYFAAQKR
jgi:sulfide dehydrogenase cytochrome subunit